MDPFNKVHVFEPMKEHTFGPNNIRLIRLFSLMLNYAKPRLKYFTDSLIFLIFRVLLALSKVLGF